MLSGAIGFVRRYSTEVAICAGLICAYFALRRPNVQETIVTDTRETVLYMRRVDSVRTENTREKVRYVWRETRRPDGTVVRETVATGDKESSNKTSVETKEGRLNETSTHANRKVTAAAQPRLFLGALGTLGLDGRVGYGVLLGVRLTGPVTLMAGADVKSRVGVLSLGVTF